MPPKRALSCPNEAQILLALSALQKNQLPSVSAAAKAYNEPYTTLLRRSKGSQSREEWRPHTSRFTAQEEELLVKDILKLDSQGIPPTRAIIMEKAHAILKSKGDQSATPLGYGWVNRLVKRTPALTAKIGRIYECQRAQCEDPVIIQGHFNLLQNTINKYGI